MIPLFEGLNEARGTWSFEGEMSGGDAATPVKVSLKTGQPKKRYVSCLADGLELAYG